MGRKALVIGATGLIGRNLVFDLLKSNTYSQVTVFARRDLVIKHEKLHQVLIDFDELSSYNEEMKVDDVFCCLGSTRAKTPDQVLYRKIDYEYPLTVARMALANGAQQFLLVSALGADKDSSIFYNRLKGEIESAIAALNYPSFHVFRPSLLLGSRNESRPLETISQYMMRMLNPLFLGPMKMYKAVKGTEVARAMLVVATQGQKGHHVVPNEKIIDLAAA